jgi:hypothetical protein
MANTRITISSLLFLVCVAYTTGQEWNYARISLIYGGDIPFNFSSVRQINEGIEINEGTILGITLADSGQAGHTLTGFDLNMRAFNGATEIRGEVYDLDLNRIRVSAGNYLGFGPGFSSDGYQDLSAVWTRLCTYTDSDLIFDDLTWDTHQLSISYECGRPVSEGGNGTLLGEPSDIYRVEIKLEIVPTGPGF